MKIFIQYLNQKFINSLISLDTYPILSASINNNLYSIHYKHNIDLYIFCAELLTPEIFQFITEFNQKTHIYVYHRTINHDVINLLKNQCVNLSYEKNENTTQLPLMVNTDIFYNKNYNRQEKIVCFLENARSSISNLEKILYPNTKYPIQIFSKDIKHHQCLGIANEIEKAELLNSSKQYLSVDNDYDIEAFLCGSELLRLSDGHIEQYIIPNDIKYITYSEFLKDLISGKYTK